MARSRRGGSALSVGLRAPSAIAFVVFGLGCSAAAAAKPGQMPMPAQASASTPSTEATNEAPSNDEPDEATSAPSLELSVTIEANEQGIGVHALLQPAADKAICVELPRKPNGSKRTPTPRWKGCHPKPDAIDYRIALALRETVVLRLGELLPRVHDHAGNALPTMLKLALRATEPVTLLSSLDRKGSPPNSGGTFELSLDEAERALLAFRPTEVVTIAIGEGEALLLAPGFDRSAVVALETRLRSIAKHIAKLDVVTPRVLLALRPRPRGMKAELDAGGLLLETDRSLQALGLHEDVALLEAMAQLTHRSGAHGLDAGIVAYLGLLARVRAGWIANDDAMEELMQSYRRYRPHAAGRAIADRAPSGWLRDAGLLWAFCIDSALLEKGAHFDDVHRDAMRRKGEPMRALLAALAKIEPRIAGYARALHQHRGVFDVGACLEQVGYSLAAEPYPAILPKKVATVLRTRNNLDEPPTVGEPRANSGFERNDRLIAVEQTPVFDLGDLGWVLRDRQFDQSVRFRVLRGEHLRWVVQRIPNIPALATSAIRFYAVRQPEARKVTPFDH